MSIVGNRVTAEWVSKSKLLSDPKTSSVLYGSVAHDQEGNIYSIGTIVGEAKFGQFTLNKTVESPFITKQNQCGEFIYVVSGNVTGGTGTQVSCNKLKHIEDQLFSANSLKATTAIPQAFGDTIIADDDGLYIAGTFMGNLEFDDEKLSNQTGGFTLFLAKLNKCDGKAIWVQATSNVSGSLGVNAMSDDDKSLYLTGGFSGKINFGITTIDSIATNLFVTKVNKLRGEFLWTKASSGTLSFALGQGVSVKDNSCCECCDNGLVYVVGFFSGVVIFGTINLESISQDAFVVMIDSSTGNWIKAIQTKASRGSAVQGRAIVANRSIYITGFFSGDVVFGTTPIKSPPNIYSLTFISKLTEDLEWEKTVIGDAKDITGIRNFNSCFSIASDDEYVYVTGTFLGYSKFGHIDPIISDPNRAFFLVQLSRKLNFVAVFQSENLNLDGANNFPATMGLLVRDNIVTCAGIFTGSFRIGQLLVESNTTITNGGNVWIAQLCISD
ncbi:MAG: hypothetical protein Harvfovirus27_16 [Harvfovirus sp.]|uniref:Uncharacterized protein n=1 Tax=Harvfovirus sp. TaxID=2487768 RepID=A0A3G5A275_9VIRU|nr:MAG: hypothetical protein Harvfovirus27_16 [Harvfovirus sp.]